MALKVAVVGARGIGTKHANCHAQDELAELVAVCDVIKDRADKLAEDLKVPVFYQLKDMLAAHPEIEVIDVCTGGYENGSWHYEPTMEALDGGKHVLVEKPISNDIEQAREMVAFAEQEELYLGCNLNHYFTPPAEKAMEYMNSGDIGELVYCHHKMGFPGGVQTYKPTSGFNAEGFPYFHVKAFLSHPFSVMRHFCGDVTHVQAFLGQPSYRKGAGDLMLSLNGIHIQFQSGCTGYLFSQRGDSTFGLGGWWSVEVGGTKGTFCIENCIEKVTFWPAPGSEGAAEPDKLVIGSSPPPVVTESGITDFGETFPRRLHAFLEDVTNQVPRDRLRASGRDALAALEYTWAAMESHEQGGILVRPHPLPLLTGQPEQKEQS